MSKCVGCGITLQNSDVNKIGYTKKLDNKYCERCFKTINYNEEKKIDNFDNFEVINKINKMNYLTLFITDLISINNELINVYKSIKNNRLLVINKCDMIPSNLMLNHIKDNIKNSYDINDDVIFISAKKNINLDKINEIINYYEKVIICGETGSGKSTLINKLIGSNLTTSKYNNTTLDFIKLKYGDFIIYDTPGIIINNDKKYSDNIFVKTKQLNDNYELIIDDIIIQGLNNITIIHNELSNINSKKKSSNLEYEIDIPDNSDIILPNGFIYVKKSIRIRSNRLCEVRRSIIGR